MTAATLTRLPVAAGGALLAFTGNFIHWSVARYMRAPLSNTGILAMVTFSALAASNALYGQDEHPAPLFAPSVERQVVARPAEVVPVIPAAQRPEPRTIAPLPSEETTGSVRADETPKPKVIGNAEVTEIQRKLTSMQIFDGAVDGLYGPQTARAIKRFEERMGMRPRGELNQAILDAIRAAPVILPEPQVEALPKPEPLPQAEAAPTAAAPAAVREPVPAVDPTVTASTQAPRATRQTAPLPAPEPLQLMATPAPTTETRSEPLRREIPETPEAALDLAVRTAGEAIDTIIEGVQSVAMSTPPKPTPPAAITAAVPSPPATARTVEEVPAVLRTASVEQPRVGVPLVIPDEPVARSSDDVAVLDSEARPEELMQPFSVSDPIIVARVQRGLASLGFLHGPADGVAGEATAKAIRNFEVYYNYKVTGRISPELLDLLVQNGATI